MSTLIIGDVHGCAEELQELLARVAPTRTVMVGDAYTRGPDPVGVHALIAQHRIEGVRGNHDQRLLDCARGLRPTDVEGARVVDALDRADPRWRVRVEGWPLWLRAGRYLVTHAALHPSGDVSRTSRRTHLYARRWPDDTSPAHPFWWEIYQGPPVIFGHDAARGHVRRDRDGRPWVVGLDTGCVYGGELSGWLVEEERRVAVPARRAWAPITRRGRRA